MSAFLLAMQTIASRRDIMVINCSFSVFVLSEDREKWPQRNLKRTLLNEALSSMFIKLTGLRNAKNKFYKRKQSSEILSLRMLLLGKRHPASLLAFGFLLHLMVKCYTFAILIK